MEIKEYVKLHKEEIKEYIAGLDIKPNIYIIQLNDDPASCAYVKGKLKDLSYVGARSTHLKLDQETSEEELLKIIDKLNHDPDVDAILVQMPLPKAISEEHVKLAVNPIKDVDGFHPLSVCAPCTPLGIMNYLKSEGETFLGKNAVIIGRSNIVGRPMAKMLLDVSCNVTVLHSKTKKEDMDRFLANADILVVAVGKKYLIKDQTLKETATVVDVGINREEGVLYGDCAPDLKVKFQTPVPGGVGLLTRVTMLDNLLTCYKENRK